MCLYDTQEGHALVLLVEYFAFDTILWCFIQLLNISQSGIFLLFQTWLLLFCLF